MIDLRRPLLKATRYVRNTSVRLRHGNPLDLPMFADLPDYARTASLSRVFFMPGFGLFYQRLPKCANSTICKTLAAHAGVEDRSDLGRMSKWAFNRFPTPAEFDRARKVVFLRDPVTRALSGWRDKGFKEGFIRRYNLSPDGTTPPDFLTFLRALEQNRFFRNAHFIPQTDLIAGHVGDYRIGVIEDLDNAMRPLCEEVFGRYLGLSERLSGRTNAASRSAEITGEEMEAIQRIYAADVELYRKATG